jgi:hypothetical protein
MDLFRFSYLGLTNKKPVLESDKSTPKVSGRSDTSVSTNTSLHESKQHLVVQSRRDMRLASEERG